MTYATAFSSRNFHVTQRKSLEIQTRPITIRKTLSSWNIVKRQVPVGSFIWWKKNLTKDGTIYMCVCKNIYALFKSYICTQAPATQAHDSVQFQFSFII